MDGSFVELIVIFGPYQHDLEAKKEPFYTHSSLAGFSSCDSITRIQVVRSSVGLSLRPHVRAKAL